MNGKHGDGAFVNSHRFYLLIEGDYSSRYLNGNKKASVFARDAFLLRIMKPCLISGDGSHPGKFVNIRIKIQNIIFEICKAVMNHYKDVIQILKCRS